MKHSPARFWPRLPVLSLLAFAAAVTVGCGSSSPPPPSAEGTPAAPSSSEPVETQALPTEASDEAPKIEVISQELEAPAKAADPGLEVVRGYTRRFYDGDLDGLYALFTDDLKKEITLPKLREMRESVRNQLGDEVEVVGEDFQTRGEYRGFARWAKFSKLDGGLIQVQWILREDDTIAGFIIQQVDPNKP